MSAESVKIDLAPAVVRRPLPGSETARVIRESFALVEPKSEELAQYFYGALFVIAPDARDLFPVTMATQRSRLLRALVYVVQMVDRPDELTTFLGQLGRDHRKFNVVTRHYDAVGTALISAMKRFLGKAWTPEVETAWTSAYGVISETMRKAAAQETGPASWSGTVLEHRKLSPDVALVRVRTDELLPYRSGGYVSVEVPQRPRLWRYLSMATAPRDDGLLTFHVRAVHGGWVSRAIVNHTHAGDVWRLGPSLGALSVVPTADQRPLLMIAGGTGIAPLMAILDDLSRWKRNPPVHVFFGGRKPSDLYALDELRRLAVTSRWLTVTPVTEEGAVPGGDRGTLATAVTQRGAWKDHEVLVAGSPDMIRGTIAKLLAAGVDLERIRYDPFTLD
ncbi:globin domain-containing protein [Amycolatopsis rhabdoformis]|uniref:nitric oxide dioxygenase n=1 Tax=Amycolatopsis rhabdoformis TaxID=1448059 RepID=A0ABZ1I1A9_9PSEU|nr:globin domain-containing protein [Amycolatopsis rhabdoformis]WSE28182.1 globin domain-containing protein [Amycolatopsis rhabdoformis]